MDSKVDIQGRFRWIVEQIASAVLAGCAALNNSLYFKIQTLNSRLSLRLSLSSLAVSNALNLLNYLILARLQDHPRKPSRILRGSAAFFLNLLPKFPSDRLGMYQGLNWFDAELVGLSKMRKLCSVRQSKWWIRKQKSSLRFDLKICLKALSAFGSGELCKAERSFTW